MNPGRFFMPNMNMPPYIRMGAFNPLMQSNLMFPRNAGIFGRVMNGIRSFNWRGLLSGANKTLNVVNQTIPLIRQAKPMVGNVKSMIQLAKAFGNETGGKKYRKSNKVISTVSNNKSKDNSLVIENNYPTFFI